MVRIIDGKRFSFLSDTLYRTQNGNWFIHGEGGTMSKYSVQVEQNNWSGSAEIRPLTEDQAYRWLEDIGEVEAIEKYFPDRFEDA